MVKNLPVVWETWVRSLGGEASLEEGMGTHSSVLAWSIPGTEEPARLQSMGLQRVGHDWVAQEQNNHLTPSLFFLKIFFLSYATLPLAFPLVFTAIPSSKMDCLLVLVLFFSVLTQHPLVIQSILLSNPDLSPDLYVHLPDEHFYGYTSCGIIIPCSWSVFYVPGIVLWVEKTWALHTVHA